MGASLVMETVKKKPNLLLCAATGSSPEGLYKELATLAHVELEPFKQLRILKLDEWAGIPESHPVSCEYFLKKKLLGPLDIAQERYISFASDPNEPAPKLEPFCHVAALSAESLKHPMIASLDQKPEYGLTLGLKEILDSRLIIMLVSGKEKKHVAEKFLEGSVSTELPASFLWQHPQVECLVDQTVLD